MRGILTLAIRIKKTDRQGRSLPYLSAPFLLLFPQFKDFSVFEHQRTILLASCHFG